MSALRITLRIFTASTFALSSPFDESGQVKDLDFRTPMFHNAGNTREGGKGIPSGFGVGVGHLGNEGGFSDWRKPDQGHRCVSRFSDFKPFAAAAGFGVRRRFLFLEFELGDFGLQFPNVGVGGLVLLGLVDLGANHFDLLFDRRQAEPSRIGAWLAVLEGSYAPCRHLALFVGCGDALKRDGPLDSVMGLEMIGLLVHKPTLLHLLSLSWGELKSGMEQATLRDIRPVQDTTLKTQFAIDAEAELLDWMDEQTVSGETHAGTVLANLEGGEDGLLSLMHWASPGRWEVWEGRAFLYIENATGAEAEDIHELYTEATWTTVLSRLDGLSEDEFAQRVVMDWMDRRKALGETLEEAEDPKIVPTFEAHTRASKALVHTVNRAANEDDLVLVIGREHLEAAKWGHGDWNLTTFLKSH